MNIDSDWPQHVLDFWFEELEEKDWFGSTDELDARITERFATLHSQLRVMSSIPKPVSPQSALASVIVLDQFSRNMFRGQSQAFEYDPLALSFTKQAMQQQLHKQLNDKQQWFLYMPFMHSENLDDQNAGLELFTDMAHKAAVEHRDIIAQFGRFPHRNAVLGRQSTDEEIEYLKNAKRFGQ